MALLKIYETERLILRNWLHKDIEPFAKMNSDDDVMRFFEKKISLEQTIQSVEKMKACHKKYGYTFWAVENKKDQKFIGCIGIFMSEDYESPFTPGVEIGWRLDKPYWNKGYATEGAKKSLRIGFEDFKINEICAITVPTNLASRNVMEKLGMKRNPNEDFEHPKVSDNHPFKTHVLYRLKKQDWAI